MGYKLTNEERETIIVFNEAEATAYISTFNRVLIRKITALCEARPNEVTGKGTDKNGEYAFIFPKKWIRVNATIILSEEQLAKKREDAKRLQSKK